MSRYISEKLKKSVAVRAKHRCEYCRIHAEFSYFPFHIEHIISLKHGGLNEIENLAYACQICNFSKGSDIATFLGPVTNLVRFFNPRTDIWTEHFEIDNSGFVAHISKIGEATIKILELNHPESIIERKEMLRFGLFYT
jgi:hypothetical protein